MTATKLTPAMRSVLDALRTQGGHLAWDDYSETAMLMNGGRYTTIARATFEALVRHGLVRTKRRGVPITKYWLVR